MEKNVLALLDTTKKLCSAIYEGLQADKCKFQA